MIHLFKHNIDQSAISDCLTTLKSGWHTSGPIGKKVEKAISEYYSSTGHDYYAALTSSCTSGLIATAMALDLQEGDEIITTPMTFVATSASFMLRGAKPVFVDIDDQGLIDVDKVEAAVTPATKGIWVVNLYGHMPDMRRLRQIADKHDLFLMEDCAHAFDSSRDGYRPATWSHAACYSFYATKNTHCLPGYTPVLSDVGNGPEVKRLDELVNYPKIKVPSLSKNGKLQWSNVSDVIITPPRNLLRIKTSCGRQIDCTADHKLFKYNNSNFDEIFAGDLNVGDYIAAPKKIQTSKKTHQFDLVSIDENIYEAKPGLVAYKKSRNNGYLKLLDKTQTLDSALAKMLGYFTAEGNIKETKTNTELQWSFNKNERWISDLIETWEMRFPGWKARKQKAHNTSDKVCAGGKLHLALFKFLGVTGLAHQKRVPQAIFTSPFEVQLEYLIGCWRGDGCVATKSGKTYLEIKTVSKQLATDLHYLILLMGYPSTFELSEKAKWKIFPNKQKHWCRESYKIRIGDVKLIKLMSGLNFKTRGNILEHRVPTHLISDQVIKNQHHSIRNRIKQKKSIGSQYLDNWENDSDLAFLKIESIKEINYDKELYDLTVPSGHSFVAGLGSILVHNCGEGGAVVSRDKAFIEKIINIRRHGMSKFPQPGELGNMGYDVVRLGFKGNLSDISASLLLSQIPKAEEYRSQRQEIANRYLKSLSNLKHIRPIVPDEGVQSSWYTFPLLAENRESLRQAFWENEIGHTIMYSSLESFTLFGGGKDITCPKALEFSRKQVSIPCYPSLTVEEQNKVIRVIRDWDNQCI